MANKEWKCRHCGDWVPTRYAIHVHSEPLDLSAAPKAPYTDTNGNHVVELLLRRERQLQTPRRLTDPVRSVPLSSKAS